MTIYRFLASIIVGASLCLVGYQSAFAQMGMGIPALEQRVSALEATDPVPGPRGEQGPQGDQGPASADFRQPYAFIGGSGQDVSGTAGIGAMNLSCQAAFGPTGRMALASDVLNTTLSQRAGGGWVQAEKSFISSFDGPSGHCSLWSGTSDRGMEADRDLNFGVVTDCSSARGVACVAPLATVTTYIFAGFTAGTVLGSAGLIAMNATCQAEFGGDARMAFIEEAFRTAPTPVVAGTAWVKPSFNNGFDESVNLCAMEVNTASPTGGVFIGPNLEISNLEISNRDCTDLQQVACSIPE